MAPSTKVLFVDDSKFLRIDSERALTRAGFLVTGAGDGEVALKLAREILPDIIVLDMMLPKISGIDVLKALKESSATQDIPVIVLSSLPQTNEPKLLAAGAAAYFEKSSLALDKSSEKLAAAVTIVLNRIKHQKEVALRLQELAAKKAAGN